MTWRRRHHPRLNAPQIGRDCGEKMLRADQWGIITTTDLEAQGIRRWRIGALVGSGHLVRLARGRFALPEHDADVARAVALGGSLTCVSALAKYGISTMNDAATHVRVRHGAALPHLPGVIPHRITGAAVGNARIDDLETSLSIALRCTEPEFALATAESAINAGHLSEDQVLAIAQRSTREVRSIMKWLDGRSMSIPETLVRVRLARLGYRVEPQVHIPGIDYVDMVVNGCHIVECDSKRFHLSVAQFERDRQRSLEAAPLGYTTTRLTYEQSVETWPHTLERLRAVFSGEAERAHRRRRSASNS